MAGEESQEEAGERWKQESQETAAPWTEQENWKAKAQKLRGSGTEIDQFLDFSNFIEFWTFFILKDFARNLSLYQKDLQVF